MEYKKKIIRDNNTMDTKKILNYLKLGLLNRGITKRVHYNCNCIIHRPTSNHVRYKPNNYRLPVTKFPESLIKRNFLLFK